MTEGLLPWELPLGAAPADGGVTRFRVWAPRASAVGVEVGGVATPLAHEGLGGFAGDAEAVAGAVAGVCGAPVVAARDVFRLLCLAWLTRNGDRHAKNVSVLMGPGGERRVAPGSTTISSTPLPTSPTSLGGIIHTAT